MLFRSDVVAIFPNEAAIVRLVGAKQRAMVAAAIRTAFAQETQEAARAEWRAVADRLRERFPKLGALMDEAEDDVLAHLAFPKEHWPQLHSTNPLERLNGEIKRRTDVVAIFPNEAAIVRLVGAMLLEHAARRPYGALQSRYAQPWHPPNQRLDGYRSITTRSALESLASQYFPRNGMSCRKASKSLLRKIACPSPARCRKPHRQ